MMIQHIHSKKNAYDKLDVVCATLKEAVITKDYKKFYTFFKTTEVPFIACAEKKVEVLYQKTFEILHTMGEISIPVAMGLSMHYYVLNAIASYPFSIKSSAYWKRQALLKKIKKERLLIANTGSVRTFAENGNSQGIIAQKEKGYYIINGEAPFMSLAGISDYLVFTAKVSEGNKVVFFIPANDHNIVFGDSVFGEVMQGSFTKSVHFRNVRVSQDNAISLDITDTNCDMLVYQRSWFQALISAPYLGGVYRLLSELRTFGLQKVKNGKKLSESDHFIDSIGELMMKYKTARQLSESAGLYLSKLNDTDELMLHKTFEVSVLSKYFSTHFSEEIVTQIRHTMGTSFMKADSITSKICKEISFGILQPMTDLDTKCYFGKQLMESTEV